MWFNVGHDVTYNGFLFHNVISEQCRAIYHIFPLVCIYIDNMLKTIFPTLISKGINITNDPSHTKRPSTKICDLQQSYKQCGMVYLHLIATYWKRFSERDVRHQKLHSNLCDAAKIKEHENEIHPKIIHSIC